LAERLIRITAEQTRNPSKQGHGPTRIPKLSSRSAVSARSPEPASRAYELPDSLLSAYHRLLDKKFSEGLTPEEERELATIDQELDEAGAQTPLEQAIETRSREERERRTALMNEIHRLLKSLRRHP
jgi:hypothetical protein